MINVRKRNGELVPFDIAKIELAISKAFKDSNLEIDSGAIKELAKLVEVHEGISIEDISDQVEEILMDKEFKKVSRNYILYRERRRARREGRNELINKIAEKLNASNVSNQNANVDEYSFGGRIGEASRVVTKEFALENCMSQMAKNNHLNNEIYIHDLDSYAVGQHNCLSIPFDDLLKNGFTTRQADVRPANSINTAFQLIAVIFQIQSLQQFGGVSSTHLDWTMVPYVRKSFFKHWRDGNKYFLNDSNSENLVFLKDEPIDSDYYKKNNKIYQYALEMTLKELNQAAEGMFHNLNTLQSRSGNQLELWLA